MTPAELKKLQRAPTEEQEAKWLFTWSQTQRWRGEPLSNYLIAIPNGAYLGKDPKTRAITMGILKATGVQPGVYDYIVPVPTITNGIIWPGLWLELKRTKDGRESREQKDFAKRMGLLGWRCQVAKGWVDASQKIQTYLAGVP